MGSRPAIVEIAERLLTPYVVARNLLDFPLRRLIRPRRPVHGVAAAGLEAALAGLDDTARGRATAIIRDYGLEPLLARATRRNLRENLYYLDMLATALEGAGAQLPEDRAVAIDVGVADWFYAPALAGLLRGWRTERPRQVELLGFEADPGRRYADGHAREDWAAWYTDGLDGVRFVPEDARTWRGTCHVATMLFPFLFTRDLDRWGLPRTFHRPGELLEHVWARLRPGGVLVVANQGEAERDEQMRLFSRLGVEPSWSGSFESPFWSYPIQRYVHAAIRG